MRSLVALIITRASSCSSRRAIENPMPLALPEPVTIATRPLKIPATYTLPIFPYVLTSLLLHELLFRRLILRHKSGLERPPLVRTLRLQPGETPPPFLSPTCP